MKRVITLAASVLVVLSAVAAPALADAKRQVAPVIECSPSAGVGVVTYTFTGVTVGTDYGYQLYPVGTTPVYWGTTTANSDPFSLSFAEPSGTSWEFDLWGHKRNGPTVFLAGCSATAL